MTNSNRKSFKSAVFSVMKSLLFFIPLVLGLQACTVIQPESYVPKRGQMGKDVMWLPTNDDLVYKLLEAAQVGPNDLLIDLGAGDGKIPIAAAKNFGAQALGIEYNKELAALAGRNAQRAGVADRVRVIHGDIFNEDFSKATVLTLYLLEELNAQLRPSILALTTQGSVSCEGRQGFETFSFSVGNAPTHDPFSDPSWAGRIKQFLGVDK